MLRATFRVPSPSAGRPFVAWALGFLQLEVLKFLRKSQRRAQLSERAVMALMEQEEQSGPLDNPIDQHLAHCLQQLPGQQRALLDAYYHQKYSVKELAAQYRRTEQAIYKQLQRIRSSLQLCIEGQMRISNS